MEHFVIKILKIKSQISDTILYIIYIYTILYCRQYCGIIVVFEENLLQPEKICFAM